MLAINLISWEVANIIDDHAIPFIVQVIVNADLGGVIASDCQSSQLTEKTDLEKFGHGLI